MKEGANCQGLGFCAQEWGCRGNRGPLDETSWTEAAFSPIASGRLLQMRADGRREEGQGHSAAVSSKFHPSDIITTGALSWSPRWAGHAV